MSVMPYKNTRAAVAKYAEEEGWHPIQVDGIPEGFSFLKDGITISNTVIANIYIAFPPMSEGLVKTDDINKLLSLYKQAIKKRNAK